MEIRISGSERRQLKTMRDEIDGEFAKPSASLRQRCKSVTQ
jgi:hypothetical protein